jgi:hypothetical protein
MESPSRSLSENLCAQPDTDDNSVVTSA